MAVERRREAGPPRTTLGREEWVYLLALLAPLALLNVTLKAARVATQQVVPGPLGFLDQVRSEFFFGLGVTLVWVAIFTLARRGIPRLVALVGLHLWALTTAVLVTVAHVFYLKTGSILTLQVISVFLSTFGDVRDAVASEVSPLHVAVLLSLVAAVILVPAAAKRLLGPSRSWRPPAGRPGPPGAASASVLAALVFFIVSALPSLTGAGDAFARDPILNLFANDLAAPEPQTERELRTELAAQELPTDADLIPTEGTERRNVVLVFLESTRADATTPYAEDLETTPFLDALARRSTLWERAYAVVPHTSKALVAAGCGVVPPLDTANTEAEPDAIPAQCLPDLLRGEGYETAFFQSATEDFERRPELVANLGYEYFFPLEDMNRIGFKRANYFGLEDDVMLEPSEEWLREHADEGPFMTTYLTVTPHHDYRAPDTYGKVEFVRDDTRNDYLNAVRYQDFFLRNLFQQYRDLGLYEDTVFVILGDHGEGFGEHGRSQHDNVPYEEGLRIPLVVHDPRDPEPDRVEVPVNELDVLPTVTGMLGYRLSTEAYPGHSLFDAPEGRTLMASCYVENACAAVIRGDEKYIYHYGNRPDEYFDLDTDPLERENRIEEYRSEVDELRQDLILWRAKVDATYERRLEGTGETTSVPQ